MSWAQDASGSLMRRPLCPREKFMWIMSKSSAHHGVEEWVLVTCATLSNTQPERIITNLPRLRDTWLALRFEHPSIAVESDDGTTMTYNSPTQESDRQAWLAQSFLVDDEAADPNAVYSRVKPQPSSSLIVAPQAGVIILTAPHWKSDGRAVLQLLGRFIELFNQTGSLIPHLQWGSESPRLVPSIAQIAGLTSEVATEDSQSLNHEALGMLKVDSPNGQKIAGSPSDPPKNARVEQITFNAEETAGLIAACRAKGISVSAAIHAAAAIHNLDLADSAWKTKTYRFSVRRDLRPRLQEPWNGPGSLGAMMVTSTAATVPESSGFMETAKILDDHARNSFSDKSFALDEAMWARIVDLIVSNPHPEDFAVPLDVDMSSLGVVDHLLPSSKNQDGGLEISQLQMGGMTFSPAAAGWAFTYQGRLNLTMSYNDAYRTAQSMSEYLESLKRILTSSAVM